MDNPKWPKLDIFKYSSYRDYLRDWIEQAKHARLSNIAKVAQVAQVHPTFLSQVFSGRKELSLEQGAFVSDYLDHSRIELDYFLVLINLERAGTTRLKKYWNQRRIEIEGEKHRLGARFKPHRELSSEQRAVFYSSWIYAAVWASTAIASGQSESDIATRFQIDHSRASKIVNFLVEAGLCVLHGELYRISDLHVHVPADSPYVFKHHMNWRIRAINRFDDLQPDELLYTSPMSVSKADFALIREKLRVFIQEIIEIGKASEADEVICLDIDLFRVTGPDNRKK